MTRRRLTGPMTLLVVLLMLVSCSSPGPADEIFSVLAPTGFCMPPIRLPPRVWPSVTVPDQTRASDTLPLCCA